MQEVAFKEAYNSFNIVKTLAPVAQLINGHFSTNLKINGELQPDMMPSLGTLSANGLVNVVSAALSAPESKLMQGFAEVTQFQSGPAEFNLNDVVMAIKINRRPDGCCPICGYIWRLPNHGFRKYRDRWHHEL